MASSKDVIARLRAEGWERGAYAARTISFGIRARAAESPFRIL